MSAGRRNAGDETAGGKDIEAALARAAMHGRRAASEALLAARALLDALSLALHGASADERRFLGLAARTLDDLSDALAGGDARPGLLTAVAEALDAEIQRWEGRARHDADARAVLRAYLGLREILWELGVRPAAGRSAAREPGEDGGAPRGRRTRPRGRGRGRTQRVPVES